MLSKSLGHEPTGSGTTGIPAAWASSRGPSRSENQDRLIIGRSSKGFSFAILADGMGGMKEGANAAAQTVAAIAATLLSTDFTPLESLLSRALGFANTVVHDRLHGAGGATVVCAAWNAQSRVVAHVGDARAYLLSNAPQFEQLTSDDTVIGQLALLGQPGRPASDLYGGLLQFIGIGAGIEPHIRRVPDARGLLLTSDGAHSAPSSVLAWVIEKASYIQLAAERVVMASEWNGSSDNGTAVTISFANGHSVGIDEVWMPGEHLVLLPTSAGPTARPLDPMPPQSDRWIRQLDQVPPQLPRPIQQPRPPQKPREATKRDPSRDPKPSRSRQSRETGGTAKQPALPVVAFERPNQRDGTKRPDKK